MKLQELFEGRVKTAAMDGTYKTHAPSSAELGIMINGKIWKKNGEVVKFSSNASAMRALDTIVHKHGKTAQVVPLSPSMNESSAESIEDSITNIFMKPPYLEYVRKHGPEAVLDAIELVASKSSNTVATPNIDKLVREVIGMLKSR